MIARLDGHLIDKSPDTVIVDVSGVGYKVSIPLSTYYNLPEEGARTSLYIYTILREETIELYGFLSLEEKDIFQMLISVSGVGPKLSRNILSGISVEDFKAAVAAEELASLVRVPGLGKKTAERLILELKDKVRSLINAGASEGSPPLAATVLDHDAVSALINLGYKPIKAREAVSRAADALGESASFEKVFKESLKLISSK